MQTKLKFKFNSYVVELHDLTRSFKSCMTVT